jgi:hypothetical protein
MIGLLLALTQAQSFCPSYTLSSPNNALNCGVEAVRGTNPTVAQWQSIFALVSQGPSVWGNAGPSVATIGEGCGKPTPNHQISPKFPCELLKVIAWQESKWLQFCVPTTPADQVGGAARTIIAFDCGYGIGQVTSGMHRGEAPNFDRFKVASDATYNMATGTQILAQKWAATNCVGDNLPAIIEHWYTATWAYNGLTYGNNPTNPAFSTTRGVLNPNVAGSRPYQERVFGWLEYPANNQWPIVRFAYPKLSEIGGGGSPPSLSEPVCASPTDCVNRRISNRSACFNLDAGIPDAGVVDSGIRDAGIPDAGPPQVDSGIRDAGVPDSGLKDAGMRDAGQVEKPAIQIPLLPVSSGQIANGCGCQSGFEFSVLLLLVLLNRKRPH